MTVISQMACIRGDGRGGRGLGVGGLFGGRGVGEWEEGGRGAGGGGGGWEAEGRLTPPLRDTQQ